MEPVTDFILGGYIGAPKAEACMRRRERGRLTSNAHFTPGKEELSHTHTKKMTIMAGLCCCAEDILSSFSSCLSKFRNVKSLYENGLKATRFEKTDFIKLDNKTSNIISNLLEILKPSKQDL